MQFQSELAPGAVNDCDPAVLRFTAHAELEASCASGISESNEAIESEGLARIQERFLLVAIPSCFRQSHSFKPPKLANFAARDA